MPNYRYNDEINKDYNKGFTLQELIIQKIDARIIVETIRKIKISETGEPIVITHFDEEIKKKRIFGRTYDDENLKMIFSKKKKIQIQ